MKDSKAVPSTPKSAASNTGRGPISAPKSKAKKQNIARVKSRPKATTVNPSVTVAEKIAPVKPIEKHVEPAPIAATPKPVEITAAPAIEVPLAFQAKTPNPLADKPETSKVIAAKAASVQSLTPTTAPAKTTSAKIVSPQNAAPKVTAAKAAATLAVKPVVAAQGSSFRVRPLYIMGLAALIALTGVAGAGVGAYNNWKNEGKIAPKVRIAGEDVGGLTRDQAVKRLNQRFGKLAFTLQTEDKNVVLGLAHMGGKVSIEPTVDKAFAIGRDDNMVGNFMRVFGSEVKPRSFMLPVEWNRGALTSRLIIVNDQYAQPAVDARLVTVSGARPRVKGESSGRALNVTATADKIQKAYFLGLSKIPAVTQQTLPKITAADLAGRDVNLGEYRTDYNAGIAGRTTNIKVACRAIDGQVFMPGETLSFNGLTGERTFDKGYRMAHIFMREKGQTESQVVDGLAGGVCQVSSTLYNAVRKVNSQTPGKPLKIVERTSHSLPVTYVPPGRDATVAWPSKDFKFRNNNSFPIYVRTASGNGHLTISLWGRVPDGQAIPVSLHN